MASGDWTCPACAHRMPASARWCGHCGAARVTVGPPSSTAAGTDDDAGPDAAVGAVDDRDEAADTRDRAADTRDRAAEARGEAADREAEVEAVAPAPRFGREQRLAGLLAVVLLAVGGLAVALRGAPDVPRNLGPAGDAGRSGAVAATAVGPVDEVVWSAAAPVEEDAVLAGSLAVAGDVVLVNGPDGVTAVDAHGGRLRWVRSTENGIARAADTVVVGGPRGSVLVDPATGLERYRPVDGAAEVAGVPANASDGDASVTVMRTTGRTADVTTPDGRPRRGGTERGVLVGRDADGRQLWRLDPATELDRALVSVIGSVGDVLVVVTGPIEPSAALDLGLEVTGIDLRRGVVTWRAELGSTLVARDRALALTTLVGGRVVHPAPEAIRTVERYLDPETGVPSNGRLDEPALPTALVVRDATTGTEQGRIDGFPGTAGTAAGDDLDGRRGLEEARGQNDVVVLFGAGMALVHDLGELRLLWRDEAPVSKIAVGTDTITLNRLNRVVVRDRATGVVERDETLAPFTVAQPTDDGDLLVLHPAGPDEGRRLERQRPDGTPVWSAGLPPRATSPVVAAEGVVVTRSERDTLVLDAATGEQRWLVEDREGGAVASGLPPPELALDGRSVVLPSTPTLTTALGDPARGAPQPRALRALDVVTGTTSWRRDQDDRIPSGPLAVDGDDVFVAVADQVHAYDATTGRRSFAGNSGALLHAVSVTPRYVVGAERPDLDPRTRDVDVTDDDGAPVVPTGAVVAVDRATREPAWRREVEPCLDVAVSGDVVLTATTQGVQGLELASGNGRWGARPPHDPCGALVAGDGVAVSTDLGRWLSGVDLATGEVAWTVELDRAMATAPVVTGDEVVVADTGGRFVGLALADGAYRWERELDVVPTAPPIVVDGDLVVRTADLVVRLGRGG